ncbi:MAG: phosphoenolpyruvate carboxylase [Verrucomicrobia bacterium]|nr:phosphoenolpyruvate carboxylase [Verrucomicrobiota bacterium]
MDLQLRQDVRRLTTRLGRIIREQEGEKLFAKIEAVRLLSKSVRARHDPTIIREKLRLIQSLSIREAYRLGHAFSLFFQVVNVCEEQARLRHLERTPEPVQSLCSLFAELKRAGISADELQKVLDQLQIQPVLTAHPTEPKRRVTLRHLQRLRNHLDEPDEVLEALWQTEEVRDRAVTPMREVATVLFFFEQTIFQTIGEFYAVFDRELRRHFPGVERREAFLCFGSWVGGDRDGNPFVTPDVSRATVAAQRDLVVRLYDRELECLQSELTHAAGNDSKVPRAEMDATEFEPREVFRHDVSKIRQRLAAGEATAHQIARDLRQIRDRLRRQGASRAAGGRISRLIDQVQTFGVRLAELDFREHSGKLDSAPESVAEQLRTILEIQRRFGPDMTDHYIVSMTRNAGDVLKVWRMAREIGLTQIDLVPLFETISDLQNAPGVLAELCADSSYRRHLEARGHTQEIMLGYSDSNKDGGYVAANWWLYWAQKELVASARQLGIQLRFFHGKGGTIDRGGGASYRTLRAQPHASHNWHLRITEQGEVVSLKYANPAIAQRNLEQLTSAVIAANCLDARDAHHFAAGEKAVHQLAESSRIFYRRLVYETPEFTEYVWEATPLDLLELLRFASRPTRRHQTRDITALRAIPWVFGWTQSRHFLAAWYGLGHAVEEFAQLNRGLPQLRELYRHWPFFAGLIDNAALSLAKTDLYIAERYASLVRSKSTRDRIFGMIAGEFHRSVNAVLKITGRSQLLGQHPVLSESIRLRNPYVDPLHYLQIRFLRTWRRLDPKERPESLRRLLALTVNGIAFGMKSTG